MRVLAAALLLTIGPGALQADGRTEVDILKARCNEQERQIRTLEEEIESLHSQLALERRRSRGVVPSAAPASALPPTPVAAPTYTVKAGDTLSSIARRYQTSADYLMKSNGIEDATRLRVGQKLSLPADAAPPAVAAAEPKPVQAPAPPKPAATPTPAPAASKAASPYTVRRGDTLYGIARKHDMTIADLKALNPKVADKIIAGQTLAVNGTPQPAAATRTITTASNNKTTPPAAPSTSKPKTAPTANATAAKSAPVKKPATEAAPTPATVAEASAPSAPAPAPKSVSSIIVMEEVTLGALAAKHGTTTEQLNTLNNWNYQSDLNLARGSEVYVPSR